MISCPLSYWALRSRSLRRMHRMEEIADGIFILAMIGMVIILRLDHLHHLCSGSNRSWLKQLFENPQPIAAQNFFNFTVAEATLDQSAGEIARMRMIRQVRNEVRGCKFCG